LADEIEHHHRVCEQCDHRREDAERDVARDVGAAQTEYSRRDETGEADEDRGEERLSHAKSSIMSPSPFIVQWVGQLARELDAPRAHSRALDVAAGRGRHSTVIALAGFRTFGVDVDLGALRDARAACRAAHTSLLAWCANLTQYSLPVQW